MEIHAKEMFDTLHPNFFRQESIRSLPREQVYEEQTLNLHTFSPDTPTISCPEHITFGLYEGDMESLHAAVRQVDKDWPAYFNQGDRILCAYDQGQVVSFCLLDEFGCYNGLRIAGPGCVGTIPEARGKGIGLKLVQKATAMLKEEGFDLSYIHYTAVGHWYARLGYTTLLHWNSEGIC